MVIVCFGLVIATASKPVSNCCIAVLKIYQYVCEGEVDTFSHQYFEGAIVEIAYLDEKLHYVDQQMEMKTLAK